MPKEYSPRPWLTCEVCGNPFKALHRSAGRFCSNDCWYELRGGTPEERFWKKVHKLDGENACWIWTGAKMTQGYGYFRVGGKQVKAHRFAYKLIDPTLKDEEDVLHDCPGQHNRLCVRHLKKGDDIQNQADVAASGIRKGEGNNRARLTNEIVLDLRARGVRTMKQCTAEAYRLGVDPMTIWYAATGRTWKHI